VRNEAYKLMRTLRKVEQGFLYSEKYARLFDSFISSVAIHEASHAVIATMLGAQIACAEIETQQDEFDGGEGITSGLAVLAEGEPERLLKNRQGRVIYAAIALASTLTRDFKFEWQIDKHLVEAGFGGDNAQLEGLNDESIIEEASLILAYLFNTCPVSYIEAVAKVLHEKKVIYGSEIRKIVDAPTMDLSSGDFTRKEESSREFPNGRVLMNCGRGLTLFDAEDIPCNRYPFRMGGIDDLELVVYSSSCIPKDGPLAELLAAVQAECLGTTTQAQEELLTSMKAQLQVLVEQEEKANNLRDK